MEKIGRTPSFLSGSVWMLAMRWSIRLIGLITTIILARLLAPVDFGIIAMAMIVVGLLQMITWTGIDLALIKEKNCTTEHYDTAWTAQIIQGAIVAVLLLIAAPFSESYFNEPRVVAVIQTLAVNAFIQGFTNIGIVNFRKELNFATEFRFSLYRRLATFFVTIPAAFILGNYWAVVVPLVFSEIFGVMLSYRMQPYRPNICLTKMKEIWSFSQWLLISRIGLYLNEKVDALIVGNLMGTQSMGYYHVAYEIGTLFSNEFVMPIRRALFPNMAFLKDDKQAFDATVYSVVSIVAFLGFSAGFGVSAIAEEFTHFVLGEKWKDAAVLIHWLALYGAFAGVSLGLEVVLLATGRPKLSAIEAWAKFSVLVPLIYLVAVSGDLSAIAVARLTVSVGFLVIMIVIVSTACSLSAWTLTLSIIRPLLSATVMWVGIGLLKPATESPSALVMVEAIAGGAATFMVCAAGLWWLSGRPDGFEKQIFDRLRMIKSERTRNTPDT